MNGNLLYAAGAFDQAGGVEAHGVAQWNGSAWSALGGGLDGGAAYSLLTVGESLYVGGRFNSVDGVPASGVAKWDGQAWSALGSGLTNGSGPGEADDMIEYRGALVVAGLFENAGGQPASNLATWDGQSWNTLGVGSGGPWVSALGVVNDTLLVAGTRFDAWDGFAWSVRPPTFTGVVTSLTPTSRGLVAVGPFRGFSSGGNVAAVSVGLIAGGDWIDPTVWNDRMNGFGDFDALRNPEVTALESYRGSVVAAGRFLYAGGPTGRVSLGPIAVWDGTAWSALGTPPSGEVTRFLATGDTLYAAGYFESSSVTDRAPVMMYDGVKWMVLDTLSVNGRSLALFHGELFMAGEGLTPFVPRAGLYRWDGLRWENFAAAAHRGVSPPSINAIAVFGDRLVVAGWFNSIEGLVAKGIAAWDGTQWTAMDAGLGQELDPERGPSVGILGECEGTLYAGGSFIDPRPASVAQWDGSRWNLLPGLVDEMSSFVCANHALYMDGRSLYPKPFGVTKWDGHSWSWLGSGTDGTIRDLAVQGDGLYAGGTFSRAGGKASRAIARWDLAGERLPPATLSVESGVPNPFTVSTSIAYRLPAPGHVRVGVFDVRGRRVRVLDDTPRASGPNVVTWDGHLEGGGEAPAGIYFIRLELPGRTETRRVVRLQ